MAEAREEQEDIDLGSNAQVSSPETEPSLPVVHAEPEMWTARLG